MKPLIAKTMKESVRMESADGEAGLKMERFWADPPLAANSATPPMTSYPGPEPELRVGEHCREDFCDCPTPPSGRLLLSTIVVGPGLEPRADGGDFLRLGLRRTRRRH